MNSLPNNTIAGLAPWATPEFLAADHRFPFPMGGRYLGYLSVFDLYADSKYGKYHNDEQPPRFADGFGFDAANDYAQMYRDYGDGIRARDHMQAVYATNRNMFLAELAAGREAALFAWLDPMHIPVIRLASPLHDIGESAHPDLVQSPRLLNLAKGINDSQPLLPVGDIPRGKKTARDRLVEGAVFDTIIEETMPDLPPYILEHAVSLIRHQEDSPAHSTYAWGHEASDHEVATRGTKNALQLLRHGGPFDERFESNAKMGLEVDVRIRNELSDEPSRRFVYIANFLERTEPTLLALQRELG